MLLSPICGVQPGQVVVKLDFRIAYNSISRGKVFVAVDQLAPTILPFVHSAYSYSSSLFFGKDAIQSAEGVQ